MAGIIWMSFTMWILNIPYEWEKLRVITIFNVIFSSCNNNFNAIFISKATLILGTKKKKMAYIYISPSLVALIMFILKNKQSL